LKKKLLTLVLLALIPAFLFACGGDDSSDSTTAAETTATTTEEVAETTSGELETLKIGVVPSLDLGVIGVGQEQGFFEEEGLELEISPVDAGPTIVTGVVSGQYDLGWTAYAPPLLAIGEGNAPLRLVTNSSNQGPPGEGGGLVVTKDSGIKSWKDLAGKKIGTNAPRSLFSLTVPAQIAADGGDPSGIELVPLPFSGIGKAVADGQVDAGVLLEPFLSAALGEFDSLENLGDPNSEVLPEGSPVSLYFTSIATSEKKADQIEAFRRAFERSVEYAAEHEDEVKAAGGEIAGIPPKVAATLPLAPPDSEVAPEDLDPLLDLMVEFEWLKEKPDLSSFFGS
jgi:NitT/TauT family transport system substrate-binding protein